MVELTVLYIMRKKDLQDMDANAWNSTFVGLLFLLQAVDRAANPTTINWIIDLSLRQHT